MTARALSKSQFPPGTYAAISPYTGIVHRIVSARLQGSHVELRLDTGGAMLVDGTHKVAKTRERVLP